MNEEKEIKFKDLGEWARNEIVKQWFEKLKKEDKDNASKEQSTEQST